jgi:hypothetical protein
MSDVQRRGDAFRDLANTRDAITCLHRSQTTVLLRLPVGDVIVTAA